MKLSELTAASVQDFRNTLIAGKDRRRSAATVRKVVISLGGVLGHAMALGQRVRQRADRWNRIGSPKSATSQREVPLAPMVVNTLKEWRLACPPGEKGLVFPNGEGEVESLSVIRRQGLGKAQVAAGIANDARHPKYALHALRHAAASLFIEEGFSPKRVQALMGHSTIQMTFDVYGHLFPSQESDQEAMRRLQARLVG